MIGLPTHLPEWGKWREETRRRIRNAGASDDLQSLIQLGCDQEKLLFRLAAVLAWNDKKFDWRDTGLTRHGVRVTPHKLREAARLVEQFSNLLVIPSDGPFNAENLSRSLSSYAKQLEKFTPLLLRPAPLTLGTSALCSLVWYVKRATNGHHDREVSGLIGSLLGRDYYAATHLTQWRSKHRKAIDLVGSHIISPLSLPVPTT
jgi:hypothetical protein